MAHYNSQYEKFVWVFSTPYWVKFQGKASTIKLLLLTKGRTNKFMWATLNSNPHEFPTHPN